jgi:hypothetical protein
LTRRIVPSASVTIMPSSESNATAAMRSSASLSRTSAVIFDASRIARLRPLARLHASNASSKLRPAPVQAISSFALRPKRALKSGCAVIDSVQSWPPTTRYSFAEITSRFFGSGEPYSSASDDVCVPS